MNRFALSSLVAVALCVPALSPALADDHDWPLDSDIAVEDALEIAYADGIALIRSVEFDDGVWEIEGRTANGHTVEIEIDGATGEILSR